jgi:hypothetical protein
LLTKRQPREHRTHTPSNRIRQCGELMPPGLFGSTTIDCSACNFSHRRFGRSKCHVLLAFRQQNFEGFIRTAPRRGLVAKLVPSHIDPVGEMGAGLHSGSYIWSRFGQPAVTVRPRCWRALGLRRTRGGGTGETTMAKVLHEVDRGHEPGHLMLSPSLRPCPLALADRDRRAQLEPRDLTAWFFGDPLPGMSALDRRRRNERGH